MGKYWIGIALLVVLGSVTGFALSLKPWEKLREERSRATEAKKEMREVEKERADLLRQQARLDSSAGREELARQRGYKKPSEKAWDAK